MLVTLKTDLEQKSVENLRKQARVIQESKKYISRKLDYGLRENTETGLPSVPLARITMQHIR